MFKVSSITFFTFVFYHLIFIVTNINLKHKKMGRKGREKGEEKRGEEGRGAGKEGGREIQPLELKNLRSLYSYL